MQILAILCPHLSPSRMVIILTLLGERWQKADALSKEGINRIRTSGMIEPSQNLAILEKKYATTLQESQVFGGPTNTADRRTFFKQQLRLWTALSILAVPECTDAIDFGSMLPSSQNTKSNPSSNAALTVNSNGVPQQQPRIGGLANRIRGICRNMDELQRDLMQERWDLVEKYPPQLRSYVPVFTTYTDTAFPSEAPSDYGLRVALRYEVGRFFASLERLKRATARKALDEAYVAYADMSLHLDRYLRVGGLYTYYDSVIDNEVLFKDYNDALVYADPVKDPAEVRDLIVLCKGPDKGKTGIVIGIYMDDSNNCVVKLDKVKGMREIRVVPRTWAAKRLGEQDPDEVFLIPRNTKSVPL